jgi:hypothetical protein
VPVKPENGISFSVDSPVGSAAFSDHKTAGPVDMEPGFLEMWFLPKGR